MRAEIINSDRLNILGNRNLFSKRETLTEVVKQWFQTLGYYSMFTAVPAILTSFPQEAKAEKAQKMQVSAAERAAKFVERLNKSCSQPELMRNQGSYLLPHQEDIYSDIISELAGSDNCPGTAIPAGTYTAAAPFADSGNTTDANSTVSDQNCFFSYYGYFDSSGPDHIYSFTLTARGANPQIEVSTTSNSYNPEIYILNGFSGAICPAGIGQQVKTCLTASDQFASGGTEKIDSGQMNSLPLNVPLYLFVDSVYSSGPNSSGPYTLRIQDVTIASTPRPSRTKFDFDGDGRADISVFRPSDRIWYLNRSTQGFFAAQFGLSADKIAPADFDGDGKTDIAVFRDGSWYWIGSATNIFHGNFFGTTDDIPVPADFNGDGRSELAVYRGGVWYTLNLQNNQFNSVHFGLATDKPVIGDFDGDGRTDYVVYRDGIWYLLRTQQGFAAIQFGIPTDKAVPADYDGDGKTDFAVFRDGIWYLLQSTAGFAGFHFGLATDVPAPADYDGDGRADAAVFRNGVWYVLGSQQGFSGLQFGVGDDKPVPAAFVR